MSTPAAKNALIQSTAGAVQARNEKGDIVMQKVKVIRYVSGKRPDFAPVDSSDEEEDTEFGFEKQKKVSVPAIDPKAILEDRRLRRLQVKEEKDDDEDEVTDRVERHRRLREPEVLVSSDDDDEVESGDEIELKREIKQEMEDSEGEEEELTEEEIERRRSLIRLKTRQKMREEEVMDVEEEKSEGESEEESSEEEEYSDEEMGPRLKPVFVRKKDRITIQEREKNAQKEKELEVEQKKVLEDRRRETLKILQEELKKEIEEEKSMRDACEAVLTDDENDVVDYESWKVRELKRIKRDRDEKEAVEKEKAEVERVHNMTDEERRAEFRSNPKHVTNKASKGKYKFLQKYYHRGAFYMEDEQDVFKRDYSSATLEDHFDKTILPKVMQVKNFGRSGRTKYTHLVDQDTTQFDSPWVSDTAASLKFHTSRGGGMKQSLEKPSAKKRK